MIVKVLVENTTSSKAYKSEHGLSLWVKTNHHNMLFDMGATSLFKQNASALEVSIEAIDVAIISHGHYDHGGGLKTFLEVNPKAKVYIQKKAFEGHYSRRSEEEVRYIGLDKALESHNQVVLVGNRYAIDEELTLFSEVKGNRYKPVANGHLLKEIGEAKAYEVLRRHMGEQIQYIQVGDQVII